MSGRGTATDLLAEFGAMTGIGGLCFDARDSCCLIFDGAIVVTVTLDEPGDRLLLLAPLGHCPDPAGQRRMLEANFLWLGSGGATLSVEAASGGAALIQALPLTGLNTPLFQDLLRRFVDTAEDWTGRLVAADQDQPPPPALGLGVRV